MHITRVVVARPKEDIVLGPLSLLGCLFVVGRESHNQHLGFINVVVTAVVRHCGNEF